jgi:drug/metabolite transporter (DMT)-like permease
VPRQPTRHPYLLLAAATLFWAGNFVVGRAVHGHVPPLALAFWRWLVALLVLAVVARRSLASTWPRLARAWPVVVPLGILGVGNYGALVYVGLRDTTATNALLLNSACPAFIVALALATGGGRPTARQLGGIALSLAGVLVIVTHGAPASLLAVRFSSGDLWVLAAVVSWAGYTVLLPRAPDVPPLALLTALAAVGVAWLTPFYLWERAGGLDLRWDATTAGSVVYVALVASVAAYLAWNRGVAAIGASRAGVFVHLMPAFGVVLAAVLLREPLRAFQVAGIALILAGVWLAGTARARRPVTARAAPPAAAR